MSNYEQDTVGYFLELLKEFDPNDRVAIPFIWTKDDIQDMLDDVVVTDEKWAVIVHRYNTNDYFCEDSLNTITDIAAEELFGNGK